MLSLKTTFFHAEEKTKRYNPLCIQDEHYCVLVCESSLIRMQTFPLNQHICIYICLATRGTLLGFFEYFSSSSLTSNDIKSNALLHNKRNSNICPIMAATYECFRFGCNGKPHVTQERESSGLQKGGKSRINPAHCCILRGSPNMLVHIIYDWLITTLAWSW